MKKLKYLLLFSFLAIFFNINHLQAQDSSYVKSKDESFKVGEKVVDMPVFMGGYEGLLNFLRQNLLYPQDAVKQGIEGQVVVRFRVSRDGSVEDINVMKSLSPSCDAEAVRVVSIMPKWVPGIQKGKPVDVYYTLPFSFKLPNDKKTPETSR
ncbi:TonB family protein [Dysgonomonas alginatilytica]|uniref:TonB family protein n=1 Tax=Dysgonomonas alginatilytica TaxID=1605892 RepID=A0A2V3PVS8_9BACT|nr:energy transducer TonB [Dysgonomonas alginatilytica]PXV69232.1 TonB family protein [Dysgonomonas alginatilytica]